MTPPSVHTLQLHLWLDRLRDGDLTAPDELLEGVGLRLTKLLLKMFRRFSRLRRWVEADDVRQNAMIRLLRALQVARPGSMREFYALAAEQMRRELFDLARHYFGPHGLGTRHATPFPGEHVLAGNGEPPAPADDPHDLERWCAFHEQVADLPGDESEVVGLLFYHGRTQAEAAELLQVTVRTVQRRWHAALQKLHRLMGEDPPAPDPLTPS